MRFEHNGFGRRLRTMLAVDFRRMFTMPLIYIILGCCFVMPILILVMTTMMDGSISVDPQTGAETVIQGFDSTWQIIAAAGGSSTMAMDMTSMCNINLLYFLSAVLVCIFVSEDFRSGYAKNLFTVRAEKGDYVISKTLVCFVGASLMLLAFFIGAMAGGAISGLSFDLGSASVGSVVICLLAKILLMGAFIPIQLLWSVAAKQKLWLSLVGSFMVSMFLFMMIPMLTPLDAGIMNLVLCLAGGLMFSFGLGAVSCKVLNKSSLV